MVKALPKTAGKTANKSAAAKKKSPVSGDHLIESACMLALERLQKLDLDYQLQSEINWCLGSFRNDGNPVGLYQMAQRSLAIFKAELANKRKGVNAKLIGDIEKALKGR